MQLDFIESINYDFDMYKSCILFQQCLLIKKVALQKMGMNNINLLEIESTFSLLRDKREELQSLLIHLINRYHKSYILYFLIESFEKSLQSDETLSKILDKEKKQIYTAMNLVQNIKKLTLYSEDSCVIFITLLTNIGIVKKVTKNIYDVVPLLKNNEVIGKNINYMMNQKISAVHNNILQNFIQSHNVDFQVKNYPLLIGIDNQGWAIPYKMKVQTCLIGISDFGASCWVKQIKDTNLYMQLSYNNNFEILTISQSIYQYLLKDVIPQNRIQKVKIGNLMPTLEHFIKKRFSTSQNYYESIFLKPSKEEFCYSDNNFKKESNLIVNIFEMEIYKIRADYYTIRHSCIEIIQVVISCLEPIVEFQFKVEAARQLLYDFEYFQAYDYEFIDNQKLLLQNYIIQTNINRRHMHINNFYEGQSNQRINELTQSSFEESQNESGKQLTNRDENNEQHQQTQIPTQNITKRRQSKIDQNEQIHNQLANQNQKFSLMDLEKPEILKKQKTKQSLREMTLNRLSNKLDTHILSSIQLQENDSNYDALSPHNINSQFQILYPTVFQSGNDLLNSPSAQSNTNIKDLAYSPHTRNMLQMSTHQSRLDSFDSNPVQDLASFHKRNGQSTIYQQQISKLSSELSTKRISNRTLDKNSQLDNPLQSNKNLIAKQKTSFFFNQLVQKQQSASSQDYFDEHSHKLSKINFNRTNSKKSFRNVNEGSVNLSAKTGDSKKKQKLILELRKPNKMTLLRSIQYFGFITLLVMVIVNIVNFDQLNKYLSNQKDDYENQDWACRMQVLLTQILGTQGIVNIVRRNPQYLQASENKVQLTADIKSQYLKIMLAYLYYIVYNQGPVQANTLQLQINLIQLNKQLDIIDDKIQKSIHNTFQNIQASITSQQIADIIVASFFSLFFIPIYIYVQKKRQDILVLFSTFGPDKIQMMIDTVLQCELGVEKLRQIFNQNNSDQQYKIQNQKDANQNFININGLKSISIEKKKNISSTTRLPIFKISLIFYATIFILVNVIYSFGIGFALIPFIDNQLNNLDYTNSVYTIHQFMSELIAYRMQFIQSKQQNQTIINQQSSISRYEYNAFNNLNKNLMQNNACMESQNNLGYIDSQGFNLTQCNSTSGGIFQQEIMKENDDGEEFFESHKTLTNITRRY
ncbi:transmembrane protein, putative (macronuclear) [Tetrahymena thermophila SB210]|uniref:Transmembrane protein, putative n=1 Tax=Tetrahymena thermophila (strain SB210) TaxID=312017 RepID=I7MCP9_TETTS|nr:transmembrane protein, putative [Tetrahymena thermophila SB210]EAR84599.2 transmembrane protein, putative [Tetrahymena thermophila SB210]|eukprot:XP_001032262.2 transmembrane protein, putative [Tetrahymena thermophila SB210]